LRVDIQILFRELIYLCIYGWSLRAYNRHQNALDAKSFAYIMFLSDVIRVKSLITKITITENNIFEGMTLHTFFKTSVVSKQFKIHLSLQNCIFIFKTK